MAIPKAVMRALWLLLIAGCARLPIAPALESRPWPTTAPLPALARVVDGADGYVLGTVEQAEQAPLYDDVCGIVASILGQCDGTRAHRLTIRTEDGMGPMRVWVFVPARDTLAIPVGTRAVFVWEMVWVRQLEVCGQRWRRGIGNYCESDHLPVVPSREHVVAPGDSALVAFLFAEKRRR